jgi:hypothetical protein
MVASFVGSEFNLVSKPVHLDHLGFRSAMALVNDIKVDFEWRSTGQIEIDSKANGVACAFVEDLLGVNGKIGSWRIGQQT